MSRRTNKDNGQDVVVVCRREVRLGMMWSVSHCSHYWCESG